MPNSKLSLIPALHYQTWRINTALLILLIIASLIASLDKDFGDFKNNYELKTEIFDNFVSRTWFYLDIQYGLFDISVIWSPTTNNQPI